jgi:hypothetical protein
VDEMEGFLFEDVMKILKSVTDVSVDNFKGRKVNKGSRHDVILIEGIDEESSLQELLSEKHPSSRD